MGTMKKFLDDDTPIPFEIENDELVGQVTPETKEFNIGKIVLDHLRKYPEFVGQVEAATGRQSTFGEMARQSVKCALWLRKQGMKEGDIIGICTDNHLDTYIPVLGTFYIGAITGTWDHELSIITAKYFLTLANPKLVFVDAPSAENLAQAAKELNMDIKLVVFGEQAGFQNVAEALNTVDDSEIDNFECAELKSPDVVASIVASSGTTGPPKGTVISHGTTINCIFIVETVNLYDQVSMWTPTIRWHYGMTLLLEAIVSNSKRIIIPDCDNDAGFCEYIEKYGVTWFACDPCVPIRFAKNGLLDKYRLPTLKKLVVSGAPFKKSMHEAVAKKIPHTMVLQCYGMTDAGGIITSQSKFGKYGACGNVCKNRRVKIIDSDTGKTLGVNQTGELCIKSRYIMLEYQNNPEATKKVIDLNGWLHSGDIAHYDEDGEIFIVDRISDFINHRGINVSSSVIESILETHPSVLKAAVVPVPHEVDGERIIAFITKTPGLEVTEEELKKLVDENLPWYCALQEGVKFLDAFPRTATGKIAKKKLRELVKTYIEDV